MLKILTVWYNEEKNLDKLYSSLEKLKKQIDCDFFYVDQESNDNSLVIAKKYWAKVFSHKNKWYADPDKKWLVENVCNSWDWIFIADADFYFSDDFISELQKIIKEDKFEAIWIKRDIIFLWVKWISIKEAIFFKKWAVEITDDIHNYYKLISNKVWYTKNSIICDDLKEKHKAINIWLNRINKYTDIEVENYWDISRIKLIYLLFCSPIIWFFWYGLMHKQFFRWVPWFINCFIQFMYRIILYSKLYEKKYIK